MADGQTQNGTTGWQLATSHGADHPVQALEAQKLIVAPKIHHALEIMMALEVIGHRKSRRAGNTTSE